MRKFLKSTLAMLLAVLMLVEMGEPVLAAAADELDKALNPAEQLELTVPERLQDGENWFFFPEPDYTVSEYNKTKLYIPIQRTGDLSEEADVILKVTDLTAKHDVNYKVALYKDGSEPEIIYEDMSIKDIALNAEEQYEFEALEDENELGELIYEAGGADIVDGEGNVVATVTAEPEGG